MKFTNFTVVIPEHNRPNHLKRLLEYYLCQNVRVIVADSSIEEFCYLEEYKEKILYRHYPQSPLAEKIYNILQYIETPYVVMCANDDFVIPKAVNKIIEFLDGHLDYNSGQGIYVDFDSTDESLQLSLRYPNMLNEQINGENGCERLLHLMKNYFQYYYSVFRSLTFKKIYSSVIQDKIVRIRNLCLLECYVSSYPAIEGKHVIIPRLYSVRENIFDSAATFTDNIPKIISNPKYQDEYNAYIELLTKLLIVQEKLLPEKAEKIIKKSVDIYMAENFPNYFTYSSRIKRVLKDGFKQIGVLKLINIILKNHHRGNKIQKAIPQSIEGFEEWPQIEKYIRNFYNACYKK